MGMFFPIHLEQIESNILKILWNDQQISTIPIRDLRLECACAQCKNEWTGEKILNVSTVPQNVYPTQIHNIGKYAIQISWSDGHNSGIYSFDLLRKLTIF